MPQAQQGIGHPSRNYGGFSSQEITAEIDLRDPKLSRTLAGTAAEAYDPQTL